ncbi:MAG: leucyl/phenylalanyl-tRNA--protein transferase [Halocynthiibacter sp.]
MSEDRDSDEIFWVDPHFRGIIPLDGFHISRSLARRLKREDYRVTFNQDFLVVVDACADREDTWINAPIRALYHRLHQEGFAQSIEIWLGTELIGGVYGVTFGGAFFGESMFSRARDGSKIALAYLVDHLRECGFSLFDTQFITDHLASLGAIEIPRSDYHELLEEALVQAARFRSKPSARSAQELLQRNTQTS